MYKSRFRTWALFGGWLIIAVLCVVADRRRDSILVVPLFLVSSFVVAVVATRKYRSPNYHFELVNPGVVRSPFGFEVRTSPSRLEYIEGDHVISWQASSVTPIMGGFDLSENGIRGWDSPFDRESLGSYKTREVVNATRSALLYLQLVDAGKLRPKRTQ